MSECPIGLICELLSESSNCCNRYYCNELAKAWPLPYYLNYPDEQSLEVSIPAHDWDCPNEEHQIFLNEEYNRYIARLRLEYWSYGWWEAIFLPYKEHPDGGLLVIAYLPLDEDVTFANPWKFDSRFKYNTAPTYWEAFAPPVPINGNCYTREFGTREIKEDGFCDENLLLYHGHFQDER